MDYTHKFSHLRTDKSSTRWTSDTNFHAPHKPLLLLAILDLIEQGSIQENLIQLNADLIDTFDRYWSAIMGTEKYGTPVLPFYHLKSDQFWHLIRSCL